ncbi:hypothetical protein ZYGR_0AI02830 [Zygosaccharomyces rouxii]|uniref:Uncharacterized protein n=1 Tax=Zygosaccharomyces rouxii TaxID=4956 RepID=A0A1Q3ABJ3_ZYGRO|nr:hypothetical protein ZYGR_0AI02830 [Zygosaccharomyces rouxii]
MSISIPKVGQISFSSEMPDHILGEILMSAKYEKKCDCYNCRNGYYRSHPSNTSYNKESVPQQINCWINKFHFRFPDVPQIKFLEYFWSIPYQTHNFIDFSIERLEILKKCEAKIEDIFRFYSQTNCDLPQLEDFLGHCFDFQNGSARDTLGLRKSIQLLAEISSRKQNNDSFTACKIKLFPDGTKKSRIVNWIVDEFTTRGVSGSEDYKEYSVPRFMVSMESLEVLELKPLVKEEMSAISIKGFYLQNLKQLPLIGVLAIGGNFETKGTNLITDHIQSPVRVETPATPDKSGDFMTLSKIDTLNSVGFNLMNPIMFSTSNHLLNCRKLAVLVHEVKRPNLLFDVRNLKKVLPNLDLQASFSSFVDEKQMVIFV